jgi:hypothetical protein
MTEHEDPRVSAGYQALGREHPPEALDAAILAASRRAVGAGPRRSRLRRWALPVSIAAVVVLTMSIVVRIELERPDLETATPVPVAPQVLEEKAAQRADKKEADAGLAKRNAQPAAKLKSQAREAAPAPAPSAPPEAERARREAQGMRAPAAPAPAAAPARQFVPEPPAARAPSAVGAASAPAPAAVSEAPADRTASPAQGAGRVASGAALEDRAKASAETAGKRDESPRAWLERIARLRREGRAKEADESLAEFRKRYPDYEIPKELREAVLGTAKTE